MILAFNGQPVHAFNESTNVTFYLWPLACILVTENATALVQGDGTLLTLNVTNSTSYIPFPYLDNEPKNTLEQYFAPMIDVIIGSEGGNSGGEEGFTWLEESLREQLVKAPSLRAFEESLGSIISLMYSLLIQTWRTRYASGDQTLASTWAPQNTTLQGQHPVTRARLTVNGIPLMFGLSVTLILTAVSLLCIVGHGINDHVVRDGGIIDLVSLLHNSSLPDIIAGESDDPASEKIMFETRSIRARRTAIT